MRTSLLLGAALAAVGCGRLVNQIECNTGDPDTRISACTALIQAGQETNENLSQIYGNRGGAYYRKRDLDRAIQDYNQAIALNPNNAAAYLDRGFSYGEKRDYDREIEDLNEAIRLSPNYASAYDNRGNAYGNRGMAEDNKDEFGHAIQDYNLAIQDFTEAVQLNPNYAFAYYGRGFAYDRRGMEGDSQDDYLRAIQDYGEAVHLNPKYAATYTYRGFAYYHQGDYDRAILDFNEATRLNPKDPVAYLGRGAVYAHEGSYERTIEDFGEAIRLNPKNSGYFEARGEAYLLESNLTAAIADFDTAISGAPSSHTAVSAALLLHVAMRKQGREDARQLAQVASAADLSQWPGPLLKLDMGKTTAEEAMAAASRPGDDRQKWHVCTANYLIGEDALFHNQRAAALARLKAARDACPKWGADRVLALTELKRLGVPFPAQ